MEHAIRFCLSADAVELATWRYGHGSAIVIASRPGGIWPLSSLAEHPRRIGSIVRRRLAVLPQAEVADDGPGHLDRTLS